MTSAWPTPDPATVKSPPHSPQVRFGWSDAPGHSDAVDGRAPWLANEAVEVDEVDGWNDEPEIEELTDYRTFRGVGVSASIGAAFVRLLAYFAMARKNHYTVEIRRFQGLVPYPTVLIDRAHFAPMVSQSTLVATVVMLVLFVAVAFRHVERNQTVAGWFMGVVGCGQMLLVDVIRHLIDPPIVVTRTVLWTLWPLVLGCIVLAVSGRGSRSEQIVKEPTSSH